MTIFLPVTVAVIGMGAELFASTHPASYAPWVETGGSAALVAAIVYIAKKVSNGDLVARPVAEVTRLQEERERKLAELVLHCQQENNRTIDKLRELLEDSKSREDTLRTLLIQRRQDEE